MHRWTRRLLITALGALALTALAACGDDDDNGADDAGDGGSGGASDAAVVVVTTVSPLRNIVENVGGDRVEAVGLVPEGTNSHTFEPPPSAITEIERADLIVINGLHLEEPTLELAEANKADDAEILLVGDLTVSPDEYVFDFSFPESEGNPNPHLWTAPHLASAYAEHIRDALIAIDPEAEAYYRANTEAFVARLAELDEAIQEASDTVPAEQKKLLTYHDSFPYFAPRYGYEIIGAIQPSDFSEPSPREVADLVEQIRESGVPAIFGSEVFASDVLETIADEAGAVQVSTLRDDDLPGEPGDPENTYVGLMVENVRTIVEALGGDPAALDGFETDNTWVPFDEFAGS